MPKYIVDYVLVGRIEIEADSKDQIPSLFDDRVGFSEDDLYENIIDEHIERVIEEAEYKKLIERLKNLPF